MNRIILGIMAAGVVLGGVDRMFGSPKGYGKKFEEGFFSWARLRFPWQG